MPRGSAAVNPFTLKPWFRQPLDAVAAFALAASDYGSSILRITRYQGQPGAEFSGLPTLLFFLSGRADDL